MDVEVITPSKIVSVFLDTDYTLETIDFRKLLEIYDLESPLDLLDVLDQNGLLKEPDSKLYNTPEFKSLLYTDVDMIKSRLKSLSSLNDLTFGNIKDVLSINNLLKGVRYGKVQRKLNLNIDKPEPFPYKFVRRVQVDETKVPDYKMKTRYSVNFIESNREKIHEKYHERLDKKIHVDVLSKIVNLYNKIFFNSSLPEIKVFLSDGRFGTSADSRYIKDDSEIYRIIVYYEEILAIHPYEFRPMKNFGIQCTDRTMYLQTILEHELIHIYMLMNPSLRTMSSHNDIFRRLIGSVFNHTTAYQDISSQSPPVHYFPGTNVVFYEDNEYIVGEVVSMDGTDVTVTSGKDLYFLPFYEVSLCLNRT